MEGICVRPMTPADRFETAALIQVSLNYWYQTHGGRPKFTGNPRAADVFYEVYHLLEPGCAVVAEDAGTGRLAGACYFHPRPRHVSLGILSVHPNYFGCGAGRAMLRYVIDYAAREGIPSVRLTQSTLNLDSFNLYSRAGFVPRRLFQDMWLEVPAGGLNAPVPGRDRVREATLADVAAMAELECAVSGITREQDYRFCIENTQGFWHTAVYENAGGGVDGFIISCGHPAFNMLGPCVARSEQEAAALILRELDLYPRRAPVFLVPPDCPGLVAQMYEAGARNCELHTCQVLGEFQPFAGISTPSFLPETG